MGLKHCHCLLKVGEAISYNAMTAKLPTFILSKFSKEKITS